MRAAFVLLLTACGPLVFTPNAEATPCGLIYRGDFETGAEVEALDFETLTHLEAAVIESGLAECKSLKGFSVWVRPDAWKENGNPAAGMPFCSPLAPRIEVAATWPKAALQVLYQVGAGCLPSGPPDRFRLARAEEAFDRSEAAP